MIKTFVGMIDRFNGRYWRSMPVKVTASSLEAAIGKAARVKDPSFKRGARIEAMRVKLDVVKGSQVMIVENEEIPTQDSDGPDAVSAREFRRTL